MTPAQRIAAAADGELLEFAPDEPIGRVSLRGKRGVTIRGGLMTSARLLACQRMAFEGVTRPDGDLTLEWIRLAVANGIGCDDVRVVGCEARGFLDVAGRPAGTAVQADAATGRMEVHDCRFTGFHRGIEMSGAWLVAWGNILSGLRGTGIHGSMSSGGGDVRRNRVDTLLPVDYGGAGDHANAIVLRAGRGDAHGVVLADNVFVQGEGFPVMGISLYGGRGGLGRFLDARVERNTVATACGQAMLLQAMHGGVVADNLISDTRDERAQTNSGPMILLSLGSRDVAMRGERIAFNDLPPDAVASMRYL